MIPQIDLDIGIAVYSTSFSGCGGVIRKNMEDFLVSETISDKAIKSITSESDYAVYKLKKSNIDTNHALDEVSQNKGLRLKSLGLKDAFAITEQYVFSSSKGQGISDYESKKFSLKRIGFTKKPLSKKDMIGNHFQIRVSDCLPIIDKFNEQDKILNFFGYQRFGSKRAVTHLIGKAILHRDFDKAVQLLLSFTTKYDSKENTELREQLADKNNYQKLLDKIPSKMDIEKIVVKEMIDNNDAQKAIRSIPINIRRFYIQAYQSYIFNKTISMAFSDGENMFSANTGDVCYDGNGILGKFVKGLDQILAVPIIGYSYYKKTRFDYQVSKILESEEISAKDFFIKEMQEVSNEGGFRQASIKCTNYSISGSTISFTLSRGSFATILLREIMKPSDPILAGF